jgi:tetratricopeptide (TPR) repeat protein
MERFMMMNDVIEVKREFGEGGLLTFINNDNFEANHRLKAFLIISELKTPQNIQLLKKGLMDKNDEVRLLSFSILNNLENNLNDKLHYFKELLEKEKDIQYNKKIAKLYWEFIYFNLVDNDFKAFFLQEIHSNLKKVLDKFPNDNEALLLLGKLYMSQKNYEKAFEVFSKIEQTQESAPFLIELYFYKKDYKKVKEIIISHPEIKFMEKFYFIYRLWNDKN